MTASTKVFLRAVVFVTLCFGFTAQALGAVEGPSGLAGRAQTIPAAAMFRSSQGGHYFEWYQYFEPLGFEAGGKAELTFVIIPFFGEGAENTHVGLDGDDGATFVAINFQGGLVNGKLAYDRESWNTVKASLDFGGQSYTLAVNGVEADPFSFTTPTKSVQSFRVNYSGSGEQTLLGWFDSVRLTSSDRTLLTVDFDGSVPDPQNLCEWCKIKAALPGDNTIDPCCLNTTRPPARVDGRAARAETILDGLFGQQYFEWYQYFGVRRFDSGGQMELSFYILPFAGEGAEGTGIGFDAEDRPTFFSLQFRNGLVNGQLAYDTANWNLVRASLDFAYQSCTLVVNGIQADPIPFVLSSTTAQAFRVNYGGRGLKPAVAWFDSVVLTQGAETIFSFDFDRTMPGPENFCERCKFTAEDLAPNGGQAGAGLASAPPPKLALRKTQHGVAVSWPSRPVSHALQVADSLAGPWRNVAEPVRLQGGSRVVDIAQPSPAAFFRLSTTP